jgi:hypothetical protein
LVKNSANASNGAEDLKRKPWSVEKFVGVFALIGITYLIPLFYLLFYNLKFDPVWTVVYIFIGIGIIYFIREGYYYLVRTYSRELSSLIFAIILGLSISIFLTIALEYVPERFTEHDKDFQNMFVTVDYKSPLIVPVKTINPNEAIRDKINVTIYHDTNFKIESVKLVSPVDSIISSNQTEFAIASNLSGKKAYTLDISAAHIGEIFNKTDEYKIDIYYSDLRHNTTLLGERPSELDLELPILNVTSSGEQNATLTATNAVDKNIETRWANRTYDVPAWITLDLGGRDIISSLDIFWYNGDKRQYEFDVSISNDSKIFSKIFITKSDPKDSNPGEYDLTNTIGRYIRITSSGASNGTSIIPWVSINDIIVFGNPLFSKSSKDMIKTSSSNASTEINSDSQDQHIIHKNEITFPWNIRSLDLSLTTYFWIVMAGVITSRFIDFILKRLGPEEKITYKEQKNLEDLIEKRNIVEFKKNNIEYHNIRTYSFHLLQNLHWKELLWIVFSFIVAILVFSSFKQSVTLSTIVLINISLAFAFGFTFDRTLELATRFKDLSTSDKPESTG